MDYCHWLFNNSMWNQAIIGKENHHQHCLEKNEFSSHYPYSKS